MIEPRDERALVQRVSQGDRSAFDALYSPHADAVARFAWTLVRDSRGAEELVRDSFTTLWRKPASVRLVNGSVLPWLVTTCRRHAGDRRRREKRRRTTESSDEDAVTTGTDVTRKDLVAWVLESISHLPEPDQQVCLLVMFHGRSCRGAADALRLPKTSVARRPHRPRRTVRTRIQP